MARLSTEAKLGLFVLLGIILLAYMSLKVGKWELTRGGYEIKATFDSVAGLKRDVPVEIAGVEVGRVEDIKLSDSKAQVTMRINGDVKVPEDSTAVIKTRGVLGEKYVELVPSAPAGKRAEQRYLQPGGEVMSTQSAADLDKLLSTLSEVGEDVKAVTGSLSQVLGGREGEQNVREIVENIREMTANLNMAVAENRAQFREMIDNFAAFSGDLRELTAENRERVSETLANLESASRQLETTMQSVERLTEKVEKGEGVVGTLVSDEEAAKDVETTLASLRDITTKINEGKGTLGKLINDETTVNRLNETLEAFGEYQRKFADFKTYIDYRGEWLTQQGDGKSYLSVELHPKEDKFYLVQLLYDPIGSITRTDRTFTETVGGVTTVRQVNEREVEKDEFKFSVQLGKRFSDLTLRGGIFESSGGAAADYYLLDNNLRLSFEAFDWTRDEGPHLKAYANYSFLKYFYATAGYDDFYVRDNRSPLVGLGLRFLDDDLKYLLTGAPVAVSTQ